MKEQNKSPRVSGVELVRVKHAKLIVLTELFWSCYTLLSGYIFELDGSEFLLVSFPLLPHLVARINFPSLLPRVRFDSSPSL